MFPELPESLHIFAFIDLPIYANKYFWYENISNQLELITKLILYSLQWKLPNVDLWSLFAWCTSYIWYTYWIKRLMGLDALLLWWPVIKGLFIMHLWWKQEALTSTHYWLKANAYNVTFYKKIELWSIKTRNEFILTWSLNTK